MSDSKVTGDGTPGRFGALPTCPEVRMTPDDLLTRSVAENIWLDVQDPIHPPR